MKKSLMMSGGVLALLALYITVQPHDRVALATAAPAVAPAHGSTSQPIAAHPAGMKTAPAPASERPDAATQSATESDASTLDASAPATIPVPAGPAVAEAVAGVAVPSAEPATFVGEEKFDVLVRLAREEGWRERPVGEMMGLIGMQLRGTPYVGATLELSDDQEVCSINFLGLDCVTFFENALDFARMTKKREATPEAMMTQVTYTRYRGGRIDGYPSRLHYTTDWFYDNEEKRVVKNITRELPGAIRFTKTIDFMSTHPNAYRQLKAHPELLPQIKEVEDRINGRTMYYVPKEKVADIEHLLKTGDIIGITTSIPGIDCSHTGMAYRDEKGVLRYLHASSTKKQVWLDDSLSSYLMSVSKHTGIMVARPLDVK